MLYYRSVHYKLKKKKILWLKRKVLCCNENFASNIHREREQTLTFLIICVEDLLTDLLKAVVQQRQLFVPPHDGGRERVLRKTTLRLAVGKHELSLAAFLV